MRAIAASSSTLAFSGAAPCRLGVVVDARAAARRPRCPSAPDSTSAAASRHDETCCSQPRPAAAQAATASLQRLHLVLDCLRLARDSAAKRAARAGWTVSSGPEGWKAMPGRVARVLTSRVSASRWRRTAAWSRSSDARWTRSAAARAPSTISSSSTRGSHGVARAGLARRARTPLLDHPRRAGSRAKGRPGSCTRVVLEMRKELLGPRQVTARGVACAATDGQHRGVEPDRSPRRWRPSVAARPVRTTASASTRSPMASRTVGQDDGSRTARGALTDRPLVGVSRMFAEPGAGRRRHVETLSLPRYASPIATGSPEASRVLPAGRRVQVGLFAGRCPTRARRGRHARS